MTFDPNKLHPEGAPGSAEHYWRQLYGDTGYERAVQAQRAAENQKILLDSELIASQKATARLLNARAGLREAFSLAVSIGVLLVVSLAVWAMVTR